MEFKNFISPDGSEIVISSTTGHGVTLSAVPVSVPSILWREVYAAGGISEDMKSPSISEFVEAQKKEVELQLEQDKADAKAILKGIFENPNGFVNKDGKPDLRKVSSLLGKPLKREIVESLWDEVVAEA